MKNKSKHLSFRSAISGLLLAPVFFALTISCSDVSQIETDAKQFIPPKPQPKEYVCYRTVTPIITDGLINEESWNDVPWTDYFVDIEGDVKPEPRYRTRAKMLWDDAFLYVAAELEDPHVWATLRQRDTVIFIDNDFEIFIDPDGDTHAYYEIEVNAFGTAWDLLLLKPYRDGGKAVTRWDIPDMKVGTHIDGTINNPADVDKGWTVEFSIPLSALKECSAKGRLPVAGDQWRIDFSRVEWRIVIDEGRYRKEINPATGRPFPEDNWVWSPQGRINMHMPEMWGYLQFSSIEAGKGTEPFVTDTGMDTKWGLRMIYYAQNEYYRNNRKYSSSLTDIGLKKEDFPENLPAPVILTTNTTFESYFPGDGRDSVWTIYNDSRIIMQGQPLSGR
ncbi:MAG: carbohydrate-binding family 9-like protein [Bacteroidales bacterium]|jgi:hypothetical protein|nr:carbohydrate-binding family 9-like protein [Bacteroidales bacterium]